MANNQEQSPRIQDLHCAHTATNNSHAGKAAKDTSRTYVIGELKEVKFNVS